MATRPVLLLALVMVALAACNRSQAEQAKAAPEARTTTAPTPGTIRPIPITVARAEARAVQRLVETSGSLLAAEETVARSEQPGTITRLHVDLGDRVTQGAVLAEYDRREFQLAVDQAQADLGAARESLARARATVAAAEAQLPVQRLGHLDLHRVEAAHPAHAHAGADQAGGAPAAGRLPGHARERPADRPHRRRRLPPDAVQPDPARPGPGPARAVRA